MSSETLCAPVAPENRPALSAETAEQLLELEWRITCLHEKANHLAALAKTAMVEAAHLPKPEKVSESDYQRLGWLYGLVIDLAVQVADGLEDADALCCVGAVKKELGAAWPLTREAKQEACGGRDEQ